MALSSTGGSPLSVLAPNQPPNRSGVLAKYGPYGEPRFAAPFAVTDDADAVAATPDGGAIVVGSFTTPLVEGTDGLFVRKQPDGFIAKFDGTGKQLWRHGLVGPSTQTITEIVAHPQGGYVITGWFHGESRFEGDPQQRSFGAAMRPKSEEELGISYDVFVARIGEDGQVMWIGEFGSEEQEIVGGLAVGADGTVVVTGECRERTTVRGGGTTLKVECGHLSIGGFLGAWRADGELLWATRIPGPKKDTQSPHGVAVLADGSVIAVGMFNKGIGGGPLPAVTNSEPMFVDGFVVSYTAAGQPAWLRHLRGPGLERVSAVRAAQGGGAWVLADGTADMQIGDGTKYTSEVPRGGNNGLLLRFDAAGTVVHAGLFGGKPAGAGAFPTVADRDFSEIRATALTTGPDGALRIGGSFDGELVLERPDGAPLRQRTSAHLDGFLFGMPAPR
jgi:outer membrane protein assembly factor BamB